MLWTQLRCTLGQNHRHTDGFEHSAMGGVDIAVIQGLRICVYICIYMRMCLHVYICTYICMCRCIYACMHRHTHIYTHIHASEGPSMAEAVALALDNPPPVASCRSTAGLGVEPAPPPPPLPVRHPRTAVRGTAAARTAPSPYVSGPHRPLRGGRGLGGGA